MSEQGELLIIGHRGASADHPENTVEAFVGAREQGADWVELDVRQASDGSLIVHHDPWYRDGRTIWDTAGDERPPEVPLLDQALDACAGMGVNVEIKNSPGDLGGDHVPHGLEVADSVTGLLAARAAAGVQEEVLVSCFDWPTLERVRARDQALATGFLVFDLNALPDAPERAAEAGHRALHPWDPLRGRRARGPVPPARTADQHLDRRRARPDPGPGAAGGGRDRDERAPAGPQGPGTGLRRRALGRG